ncbi:MAG: Brp/Blh family beta-carotene 15,15'-dioxygenase [Planctomycetota bacterium]
MGDSALTTPERVLAGYTWAMAGVTVLATAVVLAVGPPGVVASAVIMVAAVGFIGLPHGAYDLEVARRLFSARLGSSWWLVFSGAYVVLAGLALGLWVVVPWVGLALLLVGGAIHWGLDDLECRRMGNTVKAWLALSRGAIPVAGPMLFHSEAVAEIFAAIAGASAVDASAVRTAGVVWMGLACPGIVASVAWASAETPGSRVRVLMEPIVLVAWCFAAPPILAFTVYFCLWHSVRHSLRSAFSAMPDSTLRAAVIGYVKASALPTVVTWLLAGAAAFVLIGYADAVRVSWSVVFIGLFALTVPHVVLEWLESRAEVEAASATAA